MLLEEHRRVKPPVKMDGFYIMKMSKCEVPHEVIKLKLVGKNIHEVVNEDLKFFNNLIDLDLSENHINFE
jgi:Zn-finger protein